MSMLSTAKKSPNSFETPSKVTLTIVEPPGLQHYP
jgi:hypothetical protein